MPKFALRKIQAINGKQQGFDELTIDNIGQLEAFSEKITERYGSELDAIFLYMQRVADGDSLPANKFKDVTPQKEKVKEYEFKSKHLRVYAIKKENGKIVILGGYKNTQAEDFKTFRSLKKQYLESKK